MFNRRLNLCVGVMQSALLSYPCLKASFKYCQNVPTPCFSFEVTEQCQQSEYPYGDRDVASMELKSRRADVLCIGDMVGEELLRIQL